MSSPKHHPPLLGAHFSISGGLQHAITEAAHYQCNCLQLFTKNANTWKEKTLTDTQVQTFSQTKEKTGITRIISHASYLINIAGPDAKKAAMSCEALKQELIRCGKLDIPYVVLHPGFHMGSGEDAGINAISDRLNRIFRQTAAIKTRLLLETTAGQGTCIGHRFEQLASIMEKIEDHDRIGVCLDTCHIFAAGYDISDTTGYEETIRQFDRIIGLENLFVIHVNDAKKECGSRVDRHEHIGDGLIGLNGFKQMMNDTRLANIPKILETPKLKDSRDADVINLKLLRCLNPTQDGKHKTA